LVAPILRNEQLFGLLIAHNQCSEPRAWQQHEISLDGISSKWLSTVDALEQQKQAKNNSRKRALNYWMEADPLLVCDLTIQGTAN